jgi:enoyl-[acyl-carrier-protein] reductase (NADH)
MDQDVKDKMQQIVGSIGALDRVAHTATCMPNDQATATILDAIRALTNKAVLSAWRYADEQSKSV